MQGHCREPRYQPNPSWYAAVRRRRKSLLPHPPSACAYDSVLPGSNPPIRGLGPTRSSVYKHTERPPARVTLKAVGLEVRGQWHGGASMETGLVTLIDCWLCCVSCERGVRRPGTAGRHVVRTWSDRRGPPFPHRGCRTLWWRPLCSAPAQNETRGHFRCGRCVPLPLTQEAWPSARALAVPADMWRGLACSVHVVPKRTAQALWFKHWLCCAPAWGGAESVSAPSPLGFALGCDY